MDTHPPNDVGDDVVHADDPHEGELNKGLPEDFLGIYVDQPYRLIACNWAESTLGTYWSTTRLVLCTLETPLRVAMPFYMILCWIALFHTTSTIDRTGLLGGMSISLGHASGYRPPNPFSSNYVELISLQSKLQHAMETSTTAVGVSFSMDRSSVAVQDLIVSIEESEMVTKDRLVLELQQLFDDAKLTGRNLRQFGCSVGSAVDQTIAMNDYTIGLLGSLSRQQDSSWPFRMFTAKGTVATTEQVQSAWFDAIDDMKSTVDQLIVEAAVNDHTLNRLTAELSSIGYTIKNEIKTTSQQERDSRGLLRRLQDRFWSSSSSNRFKHHHELLENIQQYRLDAAFQVNAAGEILKQLRSELEDLSKRMAKTRLAKKDATSITVHLNVVQQGARRLVEARARNRKREDEYMRKALRED